MIFRERDVMQVSHRISSLSPSPTVALNAKAKQMKADGKDVLNFTVGEPDLDTPKDIVDVAVKSLQDGRTKYGPAGGSPAFRKAIAEKLKRENNLSFSEDQIVCGIGAKEILFHLFLSLLNEGDEVIINAPCWVSYGEQIKAAGGKPVFVPMPEDPSESPVNPSVIADYCTDKTKAFVLCSPNNPAGYALKKEDLQKLADFLAEKDIWVISDEIYEYLSYETEHNSLATLNSKLESRYIHVNGLAKGFAMTGWRVGYVAAPKQVSKLVKILQSQSSTCIPPFIEDAAIYAINKGRSALAEGIQKLAGRRELVRKHLDAIADLSYVPPEGAFYVFIDMRKILEKSAKFQESDTMAFCEYLLTEHLVATVPGEAFHCPGFFRMSYAASEDALEKGLTRLSDAIKQIV